VILVGLDDQSFTQNCTPPAIDDFPKDLFTETQREDGAVVLHVIVSLYLFFALAVVCDKYFVPAVERICQGTAEFSLISAFRAFNPSLVEIISKPQVAVSPTCREF
jgi:hypothetical protein